MLDNQAKAELVQLVINLVQRPGRMYDAKHCHDRRCRIAVAVNYGETNIDVLQHV